MSSLKLYLPGFLLICTCLAETGYAQPPRSVLEPVFSFGQDEEVSFINPLRITPAGQNIAVSDQMRPAIYLFNRSGEFQRKLGRKGRGPGEFIYPSEMSIENGLLHVRDNTNRRLVSFDLDGGAPYETVLKNGGLTIQVVGNHIYSFAPPSLGARSLETDEKLVTVYDLETGNKVNAFGEYLDMVENIMAGMSSYYLETVDDTLHLVFSFFPIHRAYSMDGTLISEFDFSELPGISDPLRNYEKSTYKGRAPSPQVELFARAIDMAGDRLFICRQGHTIIIEEYRYAPNGIVPVRTYTYDELPEDYYVKDFFYDRASNSFYILEKNDYPKVTVYRLPPREQ